MTKQLLDYQDYLIESLKDPEEALGYLNEVLTDEDVKLFLFALENVWQAQGDNTMTILRTLTKKVSGPPAQSAMQHSAELPPPNFKR